MSDSLDLRVGSLGLHCLRKPTSGKTIIFAHGILSDGEGAWGKPPWPQLVAEDEDLKEYGVYVFSYRTSLASGTYSIGDATRTLKAELDLQDLWLQERVVFVGHSMGGIVIRKFITTNQIRLAAAKIDVGLFLVASPSLGARAATTLTALSWIFGHTQALALRFSQTNTWLNDLDTEFVTLKESGTLHIVGREIVEDKALPVKRWFGLRRQLVEPFAAARYFGEPLKIADSDHISIAKPRSKDALQYRLLKRFLSNFPTKLGQPILIAMNASDTSSAKTAVEVLRRKLPEIGNWGDAISALQEALVETRAYVASRREGKSRDAVSEARLSQIWSDAGAAMYNHDQELAALCYVKGQGWADPQLWIDPRFIDLPAELNDISDRLLKMMATPPAQLGVPQARIANNQNGNDNKNVQISGSGNNIKL